MLLRRFSAFLMMLTWLLNGPALAQKKAPEGARLLLLSGGQREHHGYREQASYLANLLEDTHRYEVTLVEDAGILLSPSLNKYDLIVALADRRDPEFHYTLDQQKALLSAVLKGGTGYVSIHGADCAAPDWLPEWRTMLGGVFAHFGQPDGKTVRGQFRVKIADHDSPVTKGLNDFDLTDELYSNMQMEPDVTPLATIEHAGTAWPVAWIRQAGPARVFHTCLGHRSFGPDKDDPLRNPGLRQLVLQGIDWVADGPRKPR